jgi:hypothetical protein
MDSSAYHTLAGDTLIDTFGYKECPPPIPPLPIRREGS